MRTGHGEATGLDGGDKTGGAETTVTRPSDIGAQLARRRIASLRLPASDQGPSDPLDLEHLPEPSPPCSLSFVCRAQPIEALQKAHHCPCVEAREAVA